MFHKIALGTANFVQPYGILSPDKPLSKNEIHLILQTAHENNITTLDTALGYGDFLTVIPENLLRCFKYITKISVRDDIQGLCDKFEHFKNNKIFPGFEVVIIHDPQNINKVDSIKIKDLFKKLQDSYNIRKIGVSAYTLQDVENFSDICAPDLIQIPLNPFNQTFNTASFKNYVIENNILYPKF